MDYVSKFNIAFKVREIKMKQLTVINIKRTVVCGRRSKFKNGPTIMKMRPIIDDIKNLGNRNTFSQNSGILFVLLI